MLIQAAPLELDFLNESPFLQTVRLYEAFYGNFGKFNCKFELVLSHLRISSSKIAVLFPFVSFFLRGKIITSIIFLILQITLIGGIPAAPWAVISLQNARTDKHNNKLINASKMK
jgi:hypothetical protein